MNSHTIVAKNAEELSLQLMDCINSNFHPTLGIVFCSTGFDIPTIQVVFNQQEIDIIGCTSAGEIANDKYYKNQLVCLLIDPDKSAYHIYTPKGHQGETYQESFAVGQLMLSKFEESAAIIFSGGFNVNADNIINGLKDSLGSLDYPIFGALASGEFLFQHTLAFSNHSACNHTLYTLIFDNKKVSCQGIAISGWEAIGTMHTITKADGNVVYTIDDQPALDFFLQHFSYLENGSIENQSLENMSTQYPLQILKSNGNTVLRSPLSSDEEQRTLRLAAGVKNGDQFRFSMSPGFEVIDQTISEFAVFHDKFPEADALILFSCKGRHSALGPFIADEIKGIHDHWKKPMVGFFSYGELGVDNQGYCDFHNETCSLLLLREC